MSLKEMILEWYQKEKEKTSEMTKEEKRNYILDYYKWWFVAAIVVVFVVIWLPCYFLFVKKEMEFQCAVVNCVMEIGDAEFSETLTDYLDFGSKRKYAYFDTQYQIAYPGVDNKAADTSFYEKFFLNIRMGSMDVAIIPESYLEYCNDIDAPFYEVTEVLTEEQQARYQEYYVVDENDEGVEYTCGIDISQMQFVDELQLQLVTEGTSDKLILVFPINAENPEGCQTFIEFMEIYE